MSEWIKVTDRLPESMYEFLIYSCGDICVARLHPEEKLAPNGVILVRTACGGKLATHWMSLPKPPEKHE